MTDAPVNDNGQPAEGTPEQAPPVTPPTDVSPAENLTPEYGDELPEDLRGVTEMLEQPTGVLMGLLPADVPAQAELAEPATEVALAEPTAELAPIGDELAPIEAEGDVQDTAEAAEVTQEEAPAGEETEAPEGEAAEPPEGTLDDIAPGTVAEESDAAQVAAEEGPAELAPITKVSWWPFVAYLAVWLGAAAYLVYKLRDVPLGQGVYETTLYSQSMLAGLAWLAVGPVLLLIVWFASWIGRKPRRIGSMFISALVKGSTATLLGAVIWMGALLLIDYLRHGKVF